MTGYCARDAGKRYDDLSHEVDRRSLVIRMLRRLAAVLLVASSSTVAAVAPETVRDLAFGESDVKIKAIGSLLASGDESASSLLEALVAGEVQTVGDDRVLQVKGDTATDLLTGKAVSPLPENRDDIVINNRVRREIGAAIAALKLSSPDRAVRLAGARDLQGGADEDMLPAISRALSKESDAEVKGLLLLTQASI